jgi:protein transport protein SEC24
MATSPPPGAHQPGAEPPQRHDQIVTEDAGFFDQPTVASQPESDLPTKKKKRGYAAQAFEIGSGANATFAGNPSPALYGINGHGTTAFEKTDAVAFDPGSDAKIQKPSDYPTYNAPRHLGGTQPQAQIDDISSDMASLQFSGVQTYQQDGTYAPRLNQLFITDIISQPLSATEIDAPPPPIVLPPNTSVTSSPHANCPSRYVRSTLNAVPTTHSLLKKSKLPFALVIQPYGALHDNDDPVPVVSDQVISRCRRCRTYINPYVTIMDQGHRWRCNMCSLTNEVPPAFDWDSVNQKGVDRWDRPELNYSVMEFVAPQEYMVRPPQPLVYLFLFDVSHAAVSTGLLATSARTILNCLDRIPNADRRTRVGFIAFDDNLHYFAIPKDGDEASDTAMLVVSDLEEPYLPVPHDLLVSIAACRANIESLVSKLPDMFQHNHTNNSCLGPALRAGHRLISSMGGKIVVLSTSLPSLGIGKLDAREDKNLLGTSKESTLLQTANSFYKSFAVECSKSQVSIDMFLFSSQYQDVASLSNLPRYTGGQTWYYPGWNGSRVEDVVKFASEFSDFLSSEIGLEAVLRVRATTGLRMNTFYGNFFNRSSDLCAFPAFPRDQCYVVEVAIDENLTKPIICLQSAVLHTTCNGERRIRVLTLALPTTSSLADVYASADQCAIATCLSHKAVERALSYGLESAREFLQSKVTEMLQTFKKELAGGSMGGGLQFPANLRALPVLILGLIKHVALRKSAQIPSDLRSAALCLLSTLPLPLLIQYIYPKLYSLHDMPDEVGVPGRDSGHILLPTRTNLTAELLAPYGLYLLDDGQSQFLYLGRDAVPELLSDVFNVNDRSQLAVGKGSLPTLTNDFNERVRAVIHKSADHKSFGVGSIIRPHLYIVREDGEPSLKLWLQTLLVEDRADQSMSAAQWLGVLREKVCIISTELSYRLHFFRYDVDS